MKSLKILAAALLALPAGAFAQTYSETITIYDNTRYERFVDDERGAIQSGADNLSDLLLADEVAFALADDPRLDGATVTVSANGGEVSLSGTAERYEQSGQAKAIAARVAGIRAVSGELHPSYGP